MDFMDYQPTEEAPKEATRASKPKSKGGLLSNARFIGLAAFVVGVLFGWFAIGWWAWPITYENAAPVDLRKDLQVDYVRMAIDSFAINGDVNKAVGRINDLGDAKQGALATVQANPGKKISRNAIQTLQPFISSGGGQQATPGAPDDDEGTVNGGEDSAPARSIGQWLLILCGITGVLALVLVGVWFIRSRNRGPVVQTAAMRAQEITRAAKEQTVDYSIGGTDPPIAQHITTYLIGDDLFDDSFPIDSGAGEFMGECGVGIADTIGVGEPKRVSAFEVWLFDKNDIQTVTKVIMSDHLYGDDASQARLAAKGEPIQAATGFEIILETETLQMVVRVVDMTYGTGELPERSFFDRATLELAVWAKK